MRTIQIAVLFLALTIVKYGFAQETFLVDSLKAELQKAPAIEKRVELLGAISKLLMNSDLKASDDYGLQQIALAESTRTRKLMFKAYLTNGERNAYFAVKKPYFEKALNYYNHARQLAQQNKMDDELGTVHLSLASLATLQPDYELALNHASQASSILLNGKNDSLKSVSYYTLGNVYLARREKTLALRNFFYSLRIAESIKNEPLKKNCYYLLSNFYASIDDFDKAIDYANLAYNLNEKIATKNASLQSVNLLNRLSELYAGKKNYDLAIKYANLSIKRADSVNYPPLKMVGYFSLINQYLLRDEPIKALDFFNSPQGAKMKKYMGDMNLLPSVDYGYAIIYNSMGKYDSAAYYFEKSKVLMEPSANVFTQADYMSQYAGFLKKTGKTNESIVLFEKMAALAGQNKMLEKAQSAFAELDTLYTFKGNLKAAINCKALYYKYKDSIYNDNREKELMVLEAGNEQERQKLIDKEKEELKRRRNNIQYLAITLGIVALFLALVLFGMFKVPKGLIRALGFFAFLMMFEFLFLLFKKNIYGFTHGEPWKDLLAMIAMAAVLVPLHHWLEHKVLHLLTSQNRLTKTGGDLISRMFKKNKG